MGWRISLGSWRTGSAAETHLGADKGRPVPLAQGQAGVGEVVVPGAAAHDPVFALGRAAGIVQPFGFAIGAVVGGGVPVGDPFPDVAEHVERTVEAGAVRKGAGPERVGEVAHIEQGAVGSLVAPRAQALIQVAAGGFFPLSIGQAATSPLAVLVGVLPGNVDGRVISFPGIILWAATAPPTVTKR